MKKSTKKAPKKSSSTMKNPGAKNTPLKKSLSDLASDHVAAGGFGASTPAPKAAKAAKVKATKKTGATIAKATGPQNKRINRAS